MIINKEVKTYKVSLYCDECNKEMLCDYSQFYEICGRDSFRHKCNNCGKTEEKEKIYPYLDYEYI